MDAVILTVMRTSPADAASKRWGVFMPQGSIEPLSEHESQHEAVADARA